MTGGAAHGPGRSATAQRRRQRNHAARRRRWRSHARRSGAPSQGRGARAQGRRRGHRRAGTCAPAAQSPRRAFWRLFPCYTSKSTAGLSASAVPLRSASPWLHLGAHSTCRTCTCSIPTRRRSSNAVPLKRVGNIIQVAHPTAVRGGAGGASGLRDRPVRWRCRRRRGRQSGLPPVRLYPVILQMDDGRRVRTPQMGVQQVLSAPMTTQPTQRPSATARRRHTA